MIIRNIKKHLTCCILLLSLWVLNAEEIKKDQVSLSKTINVSSRPSIVDILSNMQKYHEKFKGFKADFIQNYRSRVSIKKKNSTGQILFKKPNWVRFDYLTPKEKSFIINDKSYIVYDKVDNSAMVDYCLQNNDIISSITLLWEESKLLKEFDASWFEGVFGAKEDHHLLLKPKKKNKLFKRIILVIHPVENFIKQSIIVDHVGNINQFIYSNYDRSSTMEKDLFSLDQSKNPVMSTMPGSCSKKMDIKNS